MTPTTQHQLPPRPPTLEHPPRRYYGRSGVFVGKRILAEAMGRPESYSTSTREHSQHSYPPLNQYIMHLHSPQSVSRSKEPTPQTRAGEILVPFDRVQSTASKRDLTPIPLHPAHTSTPFTSSSSSSAIPLNTKPADRDEGQSGRVETWMGGDGGDKVYSPTRTSRDLNVVEMTAKSPESSEADMEVDDLHSHLGTILTVAEHPSKQSESNVAGDQDSPPDKSGSEGRTLKVASMVDSASAGVGTRGGGIRVEQSPTGRLGSRMDTTPPILNGGLTGVKLMEVRTAQVLPRNHGQKPDSLANDSGGSSENEVWHPLFRKSGPYSWWKSSETGEVVRLLRGDPLPGHRKRSSAVPEQTPGSTVDKIAVALDSGETGTGSRDRDVDQGSRRSAEVVDTGKIDGAAALVAQTTTSPSNPPSVSDDKKAEANTQQSSAIVDSSPVESHIRRPTRSSMRLLEKKSYAESSEDERARAIRSNTGSGSKGTGGPAAKEKRNDPSGKAHPATTGAKASKSATNADRPLPIVTASTPTSRPMKKMPDWEVQLRKIPDWEVQLRKIPDWESELEMWKERETTGIILRFRVSYSLTIWKAIGTIDPSTWNRRNKRGGRQKLQG
jgi:hypothetical protein